MTFSELCRNSAYRYHHTASRRGYVSRRSDGIVLPYDGRYGTGYIVLTPRWDSSWYVWCHYYITQP